MHALFSVYALGIASCSFDTSNEASALGVFILKCTLLIVLHDIDSDQIALASLALCVGIVIIIDTIFMHACALTPVWVTSSFSLRVVLVYLESAH